MTKEESLKLSREVFTALGQTDARWREWWKDCENNPPPDLLEPANFLRALKLAPNGHVYHPPARVWGAECYEIGQRLYRRSADSPEEALLLVLHDYAMRVPY